MSIITGCNEVNSEEDFYKNADKYWKSIPASLDGMLGGYEHISSIDIKTSKAFLKHFIQGKNIQTQTNRALDCGSGIGRVSKHLLLPLFKTVDLAELNQDFLDKAKTYLGSGASRVGNYFCCGLQDLDLPEKTYDVIWVQWVTGHLTDAHFVRFLKRCQASLCKGGIVVIKDNVARFNVELDSNDSSVTRNRSHFLKIYEESGMTILKQQTQTHFPAELYCVEMTALGS